MDYEQRKKSEVKETLEALLDNEELEKFEQEYRDHGLRYLPQYERVPLIRRYYKIRLAKIRQFDVK